jgi:hypothetical protein
MEDFPLWLKMIVWLIVGGTALYAVAAIMHSLLVVG